MGEDRIAEDGETAEEMAQRLIDAAMPEKQKEKKSVNVTKVIGGGAEVFLPTKRRNNKKIRYPKGMDEHNLPAHGPDPERWLPKWQRSRFKKMAKKKGIYLKGAQGDAQIDTDVTSGAMGKSTAHKDAVQGGGKRRKK